VNLDEWLRSREKSLAASGVPFPRRDVLIFAQRTLDADKARLLAHPELELEDKQLRELDGFIQRRKAREPVQYILGKQEFWGISVKVGPGCLIPRPETEHLVETALSLIGDIPNPRVAELGTGSCCVLLALAKERPDAVLIGIEKEEEALKWAGVNTVGIPSIHLLRGDSASPPVLSNVDVVIANPPYVTDEEWDELPLEIKQWEPSSSLRCGGNPLAPYRSVARWAALALKPGGGLACEIGVAQARRASALRRIHPSMAWCDGIRDYSGKLRVVCWTRRE